jgi:hypothetical protein
VYFFGLREFRKYLFTAFRTQVETDSRLRYTQFPRGLNLRLHGVHDEAFRDQLADRGEDVAHDVLTGLFHSASTFPLDDTRYRIRQVEQGESPPYSEHRSNPSFFSGDSIQ